MKIYRSLILLLLFVNSVFSAIAQFSPDNYALQHVNLIDVDSKSILNDYTIIVHHDLIYGIIRSKDYVSNDSTQIFNYAGKYLVPGLIDAHVHLATNPTLERRDNAEKVLKEMLKSGVTSVRDMAGDTRALSALARDALVGDIDAPTIYYSSLMAGPEFFDDPRTIASAQGGLSGQMPYMKAMHPASDFKVDVAQAIGTGATGIKLYAKLDDETIRSITAEAQKQGILVWSHAAVLPTTPSEIINSGVISISHVNMWVYEFFKTNEEIPSEWIDTDISLRTDDFWEEQYVKLDFEQLFSLMKKEKVVLDATITVLELYKGHLKKQWVYEIGKRIARDAQKSGVLIAAGSDSDQKTFVQYEMKLMVNDCGFSPWEALVSATKNSALATGIYKTQGSLQIGKKANILFLNSDPTKDINNIDDVFLVINNGKLFNVD